MRNPETIILGWTVLGLLVLGLFLGLAPTGEHHTTYINGSRVQSPELNAIGNFTVGNSTNASGNAIVQIFPNGTIQRKNTSTGALLSLNFTSNLSFGASNLSVYPNGTIANAVMAGCNGCVEANASKVTSGTYTGDGTANKAIAHGLGRIPKHGVLVKNGVLGLWTHWGANINARTNNCIDTTYTVTNWDATNFYVGNAGDFTCSGNENLQTWNWVMFGSTLYFIGGRRRRITWT